MAVFIPNYKITYSPDGKTLTIRDLSNYAESDQNYTMSDFMRQILIENAAGVLIKNITMIGLEMTTTIDSDLWADSTFHWTGLGDLDGTNFSVNWIYPIAQTTKNMFMKELSTNGCCSSKKNNEAMIHADLFFTGMEFTAPAGEAIRWQSYSNSAFLYLDSIS